MKLTRSKKVILTVILIVGMMFMFSNADVFAEISSYSAADTVPDTALEDAFDDSSLLGLLARLIYAVGRFLEWILGTIFKLLTGSTDFPWADKIVFNAVALLDVNFINPAEGSFVGNDNIEAVLQNMYSTILSLAVAFFGIVVLITAIKLVISTIASEKAKYKQAIVDWAIGFVLLFCMHYFISFVFYLNEQLVEVAANIVQTQLASADKNAIAELETEALGGELIDNAKKYLTSAEVKKLEENPAFVTAWLSLDSSEGSKGVMELVNSQVEVDWGLWAEDDFKMLYKMCNWATNNSPTVKELKEIKNKIILVTSKESVRLG